LIITVSRPFLNICFYVSPNRSEHLEVEDAGIVLSEALVRRDDPVQQLLVQSQTRDGSQEPAVPCPTQRHGDTTCRA
jgi:hypothetical protein